MIKVGGTLGIGGRSTDAITYYTKKIKSCEDDIKKSRLEISAAKTKGYGFASFAAVPHAHVVAKMLENKHPKGTTISLASNPADIVSFCNWWLFSRFGNRKLTPQYAADMGEYEQV